MLCVRALSRLGFKRTADGIFLPLSGSSIVATAIANRPIEVDSRRNRANGRPPKFPFKIKSANF
jgi:hypothetical protein